MTVIEKQYHVCLFLQLELIDAIQLYTVFAFHFSCMNYISWFRCVANWYHVLSWTFWNLRTCYYTRIIVYLPTVTRWRSWFNIAVSLWCWYCRTWIWDAEDMSEDHRSIYTAWFTSISTGSFTNSCVVSDTVVGSVIAVCWSMRCN